VKRLHDLLLLESYSWDNSGMEIGYDDIARLLERSTYLNDQAAMAILIPDRERWIKEVDDGTH
jgi:hypothetical protein